jgi:hypothetical protein
VWPGLVRKRIEMATLPFQRDARAHLSKHLGASTEAVVMSAITK